MVFLYHARAIHPSQLSRFLFSKGGGGGGGGGEVVAAAVPRPDDWVAAGGFIPPSFRARQFD